MTRQEIQQYGDLYGFRIVAIALNKLGLSDVSFCDNSVPTPGSFCKPFTSLRLNKNVKIEKVILHRDEIQSVTLKTNYGYLRFW